MVASTARPAVQEANFDLRLRKECVESVRANSQRCPPRASQDAFDTVGNPAGYPAPGLSPVVMRAELGNEAHDVGLKLRVSNGEVTLYQ